MHEYTGWLADKTTLDVTERTFIFNEDIQMVGNDKGNTFEILAIIVWNTFGEIKFETMIDFIAASEALCAE